MAARQLMRVAMLALAGLPLAACSQAGPAAATGTYAGCHVSGEERSEFHPRGTQELWWLRGDLGPAARAARAQPGPSGRGRAVFVVVQGELSAEGHYGHMGQYPRTLTVLRVISARPPVPEDGCPF